MPTKHVLTGDTLVGKRLLGEATSIRTNTLEPPVCDCCIRLTLEKTRGRNSVCYIDKKVSLLPEQKVSDIIKEIKKGVEEFYLKKTAIIDKRFQYSHAYYDEDDFLEGEMLIAFCAGHEPPSPIKFKHGHGKQQVKGIVGNPNAFCYIDKPVSKITGFP